MNLIEILRNHSKKNFTGKINFLLETSGQQVGVIFFSEKKIVGCCHGRFVGIKALLDLAYYLRTTREVIRDVAEAESVESLSCWNGVELTLFEEQLTRFEPLLSKMPPKGVRLVLNGEFIIEGASVAPEEFETLEVVSDYSTLGEIFAHTPLSLYQTLNALISLRKKGAFKVVGKR